MPDIEKVIKDLLTLREAIIEEYINVSDSLQTVDDALELLEAQQEIINRYQWEDGEPK